MHRPSLNSTAWPLVIRESPDDKCGEDAVICVSFESGGPLQLDARGVAEAGGPA
jgi:hypothetical protein